MHSSVSPFKSLMGRSFHRLQKEYEVLEKYLADEQDLIETDSYKKAAEILKDAKAELET